MRLTALEPSVSKFCVGNFVPVNYTDVSCHASMCLGFKPHTTLPNDSFWPDFSILSSFLTFFVLYVCVPTLEIFCCISGLGFIRGSRQVVVGILITCQNRAFKSSSCYFLSFPWNTNSQKDKKERFLGIFLFFV